MREFKVVSEFEPSGDQQQAIDKLSEGFLRGDKFQTLKGVTGSGKTFTMAKIIEKVQRPTLIISHNKSLSAKQRRWILCFLLRLLSTRSLRCSPWPLHWKRLRH